MVRKRGYVVFLESTETFEFCVVSMKIPNARSRYQDIISSTLEMKDARKREVHFSVQPKDQVIEID